MELLINMAIGGTATACLILLVKQLFGNKLTPKWHAAIWLILVVRLLVPGLPESDLSVFNAVPRVDRMETTTRYGSELPYADSDALPGDAGVLQGETGGLGLQDEVKMRNLSLQVPAAELTRRGIISVREQSAYWLIFAWAAGAAVLAACFVGSAAVFHRRAAKFPLCRDTDLLALFEECEKEAGVKGGRISLRMGGNTPMLLGIRRPVILIPEGYGQGELRHILLHELCHYKHRDIWINMLCCFLLSVYWFNPVLWLCFFVVRRDLEMLCDYRVVELTGERKAYAAVLLRAALKKNRFIFATTSLQNGEKEVAKRIKSLAYFKKPRLWISAGAVVLLLVIGVLCLTNGSFGSPVIHDAGEGYFLRIPQSWKENAVRNIYDGQESFVGDTVFYDKEGNPFGGIDMLGVDLTSHFMPSALRQQGIPYDEIDYETVELPWPNHSSVLSRRVIGDLLEFPVILVELERDSETAAQEAERNASGDNTPSKKIKQTHIFLWPRPTSSRVFNLWADSDKVSEAELLEIAKTFQMEDRPWTYKPAGDFSGDWEKTARELLKDYFENYADAELTRASDVSGYSIQSLKRVADGSGSWSILYPGAAVFQIDYTLDVAYPDEYAFAGGNFEIGEGNRTKIFKDELVVFSRSREGRTAFIGFISAPYAAELGQATAIISLINQIEMEERAAALIEAKTPYIGDNSKVGKLIGLMPLAQYFDGMELQTEKEPYGLTVNYDLTEIGNLIFVNGAEGPPLPEVNPYIRSQMYQNAAMLLSLIDNAGTVSLKVNGLSEKQGVNYTFDLELDRASLNEKFIEDARWSAESVETYCDFLRALEMSQIFPQEEDSVFRINWKRSL